MQSIHSTPESLGMSAAAAAEGTAVEQPTPTAAEQPAPIIELCYGGLLAAAESLLA
jgi:hypothetical protein